MYLNTSPAREKYYLSDTSPAPEKPGKFLKTPFRRRRSAYMYILLSGAGEAGEAGEAVEVFIYTGRGAILYAARQKLKQKE